MFARKWKLIRRFEQASDLLGKLVGDKRNDIYGVQGSDNKSIQHPVGNIAHAKGIIRGSDIAEGPGLRGNDCYDHDEQVVVASKGLYELTGK